MSVLSQPLSLNPLKDIAKVDKVNYSTGFDNLFLKMDDFDKFSRTGKVSYNMLKYIPGLAKSWLSISAAFNRNEKEICRWHLPKQKVMEFNIQLTKGHYTNF